MRENDHLAEIWEDALRCMRDCFDFSDEDEDCEQRSLSVEPSRAEGGGALSAAKPWREGEEVGAQLS